MKYIWVSSFVPYYYGERGLSNNFPQAEYQDHLQAESVDSGYSFLAIPPPFSTPFSVSLIPCCRDLISFDVMHLTITAKNFLKVSQVLLDNWWHFKFASQFNRIQINMEKLSSSRNIF